VCFDKPLDSIQFASVETSTALKPDRVQPQLGSVVVTLNVNVRWFVAIASIEEESVRSDT